MLDDLNLLTTKQLFSRVLQLRRENQCLNTELLRYKLISNCYEKLCNVLQLCHKNNDEINELRSQIKVLNASQVCEIKLNIVENDSNHEIDRICPTVPLIDNSEQTQSSLNVRSSEHLIELVESVDNANETVCLQSVDDRSDKPLLFESQRIQSNGERHEIVSKEQHSETGRTSLALQQENGHHINIHPRVVEASVDREIGAEVVSQANEANVAICSDTTQLISVLDINQTEVSVTPVLSALLVAPIITNTQTRGHTTATASTDNIKSTEENDDLASIYSVNSNSVNYSSDTECYEEIEQTTKNKRKRKAENNVKRKKAIYTCFWNGCGKSFNDRRSFRSHKDFHNNFTDTKEKDEDVLKCDFDGCNYSTTKKSIFSKHKLIHNRRTKYECGHNNCTVSVRSEYSLKQHKLNCHPELFPELKEIKCDFDGCNYVSKFAKQLNRHKISHFPYKCEKCHKRFKISDILNEHIVKHDQKGNFVCDFPNCDQSFALSSDLLNHRFTHTTFKCDWDDCSKSFKNPHCLRKHILDIHQKLRKRCMYPCEWKDCDKKFNSRKSCREHLNVHTGEKPIACEWPGCDKCFRSDSKLMQHMNNHRYTGKNRLYRCSWPGCEFRTNNSYNIQAHTDIHKGIKNFVCEWPQCDYRSTRKANLDTHIKKIHKRL